MTTFVLLAMTIAAPAPKDAAKPPSIVGTWKVEEMTFGGRVFPGSDVTYEFTADGKVIQRAAARPGTNESTYSLNAKKTPAEYNWTPSAGGEAIPGIYKIEKDTLTICRARALGEPRPTTFEAAEGSQALLMVYKRVKDKE